MNFLNTGLILIPEVFILYKKVWGLRGPGGVTFDVSSLLKLLIKVNDSFF